jgi:hypothetical protein
MSTATEVAPADLTAHDFQVECEAERWYIFVPEQALPACRKPAAVIATIHNFHTCQATEKWICGDCLKDFRAACYTCGAVRVTNVRPLKP